MIHSQNFSKKFVNLIEYIKISKNISNIFSLLIFSNRWIIQKKDKKLLTSRNKNPNPLSNHAIHVKNNFRIISING